MRQVNLVNSADEVVGQTDLLDAHRGFGKKHQAISLFLFRHRADGGLELLLQQRSKHKIVGTLQWANTLCANLIPGENHLFCLKRRLKEELGIVWQEDWLLQEALVLDYQVACENGFAENEIDHIFVGLISKEKTDRLLIVPDALEVLNFEWLDWQLVKQKQFTAKKITPWFALFLNQKTVLTKIEQILQTWQKQI
jgi:isopentenyl-diphosphate delta-isomerase